MTSGDVTAAFLLRHRAGKSVYLVGTPELTENFHASGISLLTGKEPRADIVVTSFDNTLTYEKLSEACRLIRGGAEYLSTHPDVTCPTETGSVPDSGAIAAFITAATGQNPIYFGKPYPETMEMICETTGCETGEMAISGIGSIPISPSAAAMESRPCWCFPARLKPPMSKRPRRPTVRISCLNL